MEGRGKGGLGRSLLCMLCSCMDKDGIKEAEAGRVRKEGGAKNR